MFNAVDSLRMLERIVRSEHVGLGLLEIGVRLIETSIPKITKCPQLENCDRAKRNDDITCGVPTCGVVARLVKDKRSTTDTYRKNKYY